MLKKNKLKFCVIGCGNISLKYFIEALMKSENSEVVVCVDHGIKKKKIVEEKFNLPFALNFSDALKDYDFDAVYIATPTGLHKNYALEAAENGKHILCEKSLASNLVDAEEIIFAAQNNNVALFEGFMYQFHLQNVYVNELLKKGLIGRVFMLNAWFGFPKRPTTDFRLIKQKGGSGLLDAGAYTVHLSRNFFGMEPIACFSDLRFKKDVDIRGSISLSFPEYRSAQLYYSMNSFYKNKYELWGKKGVISVERAFSVAPDYIPKITLETENGIEHIVLEPDNHFVKEIDYFCKNFKKSTFRNKWYEEAISQANALENIIQYNKSH